MVELVVEKHAEMVVLITAQLATGTFTTMVLKKQRDGAAACQIISHMSDQVERTLAARMHRSM